MKWVFLTVAVVVLGGVSAFAIYTFGWRDTERDEALDMETGMSLTARESVELAQAQDALIRLRNEWAVGGSFEGGNEVFSACERLALLVRRKPFAQGVIPTAEDMLDFLSDGTHFSFVECRMRLGEAVEAALSRG